MSKNAHTPGPWSYWSGYNPFDKIEAQVTAEGGDIVIASYNHLIEEGEANAQLMAAAPDLLEALEAVLSKIENSDEWWMDCPDRGGFDKASILSIIAKAKGESA